MLPFGPSRPCSMRHRIFSTRIFYVNLFTEMIRLPPQTMLCVCAIEPMGMCAWFRSRTTLFLLALLPQIPAVCRTRASGVLGGMWMYVSVCTAYEMSDFASWKIEKKISLGVTIHGGARFFRFVSPWRLCNALINVYLNRSIRAINNWVVYWVVPAVREYCMLPLFQRTPFTPRKVSPYLPMVARTSHIWSVFDVDRLESVRIARLYFSLWNDWAYPQSVYAP